MNAFGIAILEQQVCFIKDGATKHEALECIIDAVGKNPVVEDCAAFRRAVHEREEIMSTGIGGGIAIPHVRLPQITSPTLGVGICAGGVEFDTLDNNPVNILVLFATPETSEKEYLSLLAKVMMSLRSGDLFDALVACHTPAEVCALLNG
ncbi:MAG: PTS sugar transporter subunit IIA [Candidatus Hydrogenedentes bacterium]|nr:PTS sugar transporter subunit IIA [Candidatus Hydrogenedentota bacterium]